MEQEERWAANQIQTSESDSMEQEERGVANQIQTWRTGKQVSSQSDLNLRSSEVISVENQIEQFNSNKNFFIIFDF